MAIYLRNCSRELSTFTLKTEHLSFQTSIRKKEKLRRGDKLINKVTERFPDSSCRCFRSSASLATYSTGLYNVKILYEKVSFA